MGTVLVKDINSDLFGTIPLSSSPKFLTNVNGTLFFTASRTTDDEELWKSDGTEAGTVLVKDIRPGAEPSFPERLVNMNGILYFRAANSMENSYELWRSDGTEAGTYMVKNIDPRPNYPGFSSPFLPGRYITLPVVNDELYFYGSDMTSGDELWKSDGTEVGTTLVKDIFPGDSGSYPVWLVGNGAKLYFVADNGTNGLELWQSDGSEVGTMMVADIISGSGGSDPSSLTIIGNRLFFSADDGIHGRELWIMATVELNMKAYLPMVLR